MAIVAMLLAMGSAHAAGDVMIVFDASNSMWGQIDGVAKIEIAREVMGDLLADWDPDTNIGLIAYGHRRADDCSDIETIIPPGPLDANAFTAAVNSLTPRGRTPLTDAVEQAARVLSYRDNPGTVILISDGIESCDRDPCAAARLLEENGINFTAHVIGFGLQADQDTTTLSCLANETGGLFLTADNAAELGAALNEVRDTVAPPAASNAGNASIGPPVACDLAALSFALGGDATVDDNGLTLTAWTWQAGTAFLQNPTPLGPNAAFSAQFSFVIGNPTSIGDEDGPGADGLTFTIHQQATAVGGTGGGIGYEGITPSVAIEFDTYNNGDVDRDNGNHVAIDIDGSMNSVAFQALPGRLNDGNVHNVWVDYDGATKLLSVYVADGSTRPAEPTLTYAIDLNEKFGGQPVYLGFTSGTGAGGGTHRILSWSFAPTICP